MDRDVSNGTMCPAVPSAALRSEPFLVLTLSKLRYVLRLVETSHMKRAMCGGECQPLPQVLQCPAGPNPRPEPHRRAPHWSRGLHCTPWA